MKARKIWFGFLIVLLIVLAGFAIYDLNNYETISQQFTVGDYNLLVTSSGGSYIKAMIIEQEIFFREQQIPLGNDATFLVSFGDFQRDYPSRDITQVDIALIYSPTELLDNTNWWSSVYAANHPELQYTWINLFEGSPLLENLNSLPNSGPKFVELQFTPLTSGYYRAFERTWGTDFSSADPISTTVRTTVIARSKLLVTQGGDVVPDTTYPRRICSPAQLACSFDSMDVEQCSGDGQEWISIDTCSETNPCVVRDTVPQCYEKPQDPIDDTPVVDSSRSVNYILLGLMLLALFLLVTVIVLAIRRR